MGKNEVIQSASAALGAKYFQKEYGHFIDGKWVDGASGEKIAMMNPATGEILSHIQSGSPPDVDRAVAAAHRAFPKWSRSTAAERQAILIEMARRLRTRLADYAMMETLNNGKPISEAMGFDLPMAIEQFEVFAGAAFQLKGETVDTQGSIALVHREPLGVCAQIIPWNVPMIMMAWKIAPALAAGNTVVLKPSEIVCLSVLEFFREMADLIPPGVVNVVTGYGPKVGEALVTDPRVKKVAFTGSRPTAQKLIQYASVNLIPQTLELGGKNSNIICSDANIEAAAESAALSTILNKGEVCVAGTRLFVHEDVADSFTDRLCRNLKMVRGGDPTNPMTRLGPQASSAQFNKVLGYLELGPKEGARAILGGARAKVEGFESGFFIEPTVFDNVANKMRIAQEEIFGPVATIIRWKDEDDLVRQANETTYGLAAGLWTRDLARTHRLARALEVGCLWVNRYFNFMPNVAMGGYKQSGFGVENGFEALKQYTHSKAVCISLDDSPLGLFPG